MAKQLTDRGPSSSHDIGIVALTLYSKPSQILLELLVSGWSLQIFLSAQLLQVPCDLMGLPSQLHSLSHYCSVVALLGALFCCHWSGLLPCEAVVGLHLQLNQFLHSVCVWDFSTKHISFRDTSFSEKLLNLVETLHIPPPRLVDPFHIKNCSLIILKRLIEYFCGKWPKQQITVLNRLSCLKTCVEGILKRQDIFFFFCNNF